MNTKTITILMIPNNPWTPDDRIPTRNEPETNLNPDIFGYNPQTIDTDPGPFAPPGMIRTYCTCGASIDPNGLLHRCSVCNCLTCINCTVTAFGNPYCSTCHRSCDEPGDEDSETEKETKTEITYFSLREHTTWKNQ